MSFARGVGGRDDGVSDDADMAFVRVWCVWRANPFKKEFACLNPHNVCWGGGGCLNPHLVC